MPTHTWYLSQAPPEIICHVEKFFHLTDWNSPHNRLSCGNKFSKREMWRKSVMWRNKLYHLWCFVALYSIVLQNHFFAIYAVLSQNWLSRFTRFCVEKNLAKKCACGEKMTNTRYVPVLTISVGYQDLTNWPLTRLLHPIWNSGILHNIQGSKPGQRGSDHGARTRSQHGRRPWRRGGQWRLWWWASTSAWRGSWPCTMHMIKIIFRQGDDFIMGPRLSLGATKWSSCSKRFQIF